MRDIIWPNRLRELRKAMNSPKAKAASLEEVAGALGCSYSYLSKLERGHQRPDRSMLARLAAFYSVPIDTIALSGGRVEIDDQKIIGAYIRVLRKNERISIQALAHDLGMSASQLRLIEAGQRPFDTADDVTRRIAAFFDYASADDFLEEARSAGGSKKLLAELEDLHPNAFVSDEWRGLTLFGGERIGVPPHVRERMNAGELAFLVNGPVPNWRFLEGSYLVGHPGNTSRDMGEPFRIRCGARPF